MGCVVLPIKRGEASYQRPLDLHPPPPPHPPSPQYIYIYIYIYNEVDGRMEGRKDGWMDVIDG